ncbi:MAG: insulinase family protein [Lachnospiraceae bacterium]|nr:insulinase family protein [Lachnospiraceae bacterium]
MNSAYELIKTEYLKDINATGKILRHKKTGARVALIPNDDENKVFYIAFRTPVSDSTGVPHIIEHTVLCGSDEFPAKDPFIELAKGSLNTFLNAMTYPDKTVYPVASCNDADFDNLVHVYLDAVFHPNIYKRKEIFMQEGWHYELESEDSDIIYNGVVYNEMKGAFSSLESVLERATLNALYPDTGYAFESGGDPENIPELTYENYLDFHRKYYHPSNSYIFLYGNLDMDKKLEWIDENYLSKYDALQVDSAIKEQKPFEKPSELTINYPIGSNEEEEDNTYLSVSYSVGDALDTELGIAFDILSYALLDAPGAPLKQALIDAGIGDDVLDSYEGGIRQPMLTITAKNANVSDFEKFKEVINGTLKSLIEKGFDKRTLLAGINREDFAYREADFGHYPKGLIYGLDCMDGWLHDDLSPFINLKAGDIYANLREKLKEGRYFEDIAEKYLLNNTHIAYVILAPEKGLTAKRDEALKAKLSAYKESLSKEEIKDLIEKTKALKDYQEEPTPKEDLLKIPMLKREDMKKEASFPVNEETEVAGVKTVLHVLPTNGIDYVSIMFDMKNVLEEELPYVGILKNILGFMNTKNYDYKELNNEIDLYLGGLALTNSFFGVVGDGFEVKTEMRFKTLTSGIEKAFELTKEILLTTDMSDDKRLKEILAQSKSRLESGLSSSGHVYSAMRAMSYFARSSKFDDLTGGISYYRVLSEYCDNFDAKKDELRAKLKKICEKLFVNENLLLSITVNDDTKRYEEHIKDLLAALPAKPDTKDELKFTFERKNEGFKDASQIQYVSRAGNFKRHGFEYTGALRFLKVLLNYEYLWNNIRVLGGAYGCMSGFTRGGASYFSSYRDPNLRKTNEVFDGVAEFLKTFDADERDMTKYIIGAIGALDTPMTVSTKATWSNTAYFSKVTNEMIQKERDEILSAEPEDIRALAPLIQSVLDENNLCVIGNEKNIESEEDLFMNTEDLIS